MLQTFSFCPFKCDKEHNARLLMEQQNIIKSLSGNEGRSQLNEHCVPGKTSDNSIKKAEVSTYSWAKDDLWLLNLRQVFA